MRTFAILFHCSALLLLAQSTPVEDYQISGMVIDHLTSKPLNHVLVEIVRISKGGGDASVITNEDGRFAFLHMPKGKYHLSAEKRGQPPQGYHSDGNYSTAIVVDGQQKTDGIVFALRTGASISGNLLGDDGEPVHNAQLQLYRENVTNGEALTSQVTATNSSSSGQFQFSHLEPGRYYVAASGTPWFSQMIPRPFAQAGTGPAEVVYPVTFYGDTTDGAAARAIAVIEGSSAKIQINLHTMPGIRVKLAQHVIQVGLFVPGPGGSQVPVSAAYSGGGNAQMNSESELFLTNIPAGRYEVQWINESGRFDGGLQSVDLTNGSTLAPDQAAGSVVTGKIVYNGKRPDGNQMVFLGNGRGRGLTAEVATDGTFKFPKVSAGNYQVHQNGNGFLITSVAALGARLIGDNVEVSSNSAVNLAINADPTNSLVTLEGFATHDSYGVAGAMVLLLPKDLGHSRLVRRDQSDADGSFTLPNIIPGQYILIAIDDGLDIAYKNQAVIQPYLAGGVSVTIPSPSNTPLKVPVQKRRF